MPLLGWLGGLKLRLFLGHFDGWIAFGLLLFVGTKMIWESFKIDAAERKTDPTDIYILFVLSIATSIDAFAAGMSFAMLNVSIITPIIVIGVVTFVMSFTGVLIGNKAGHFFEKKIQAAGGILLIAIGLKILLSHTS
jgi:putative Mn2+ efflux pump MntP